MLELPTEAKGRLGKCPACAATFTIGQTPQPNVTSLPDSATKAGEGLQQIAEQIESPEQDVASDRDAIDEPPASARNLTATRPLQVTECAIEDILPLTLAIFRARWAACVVPFAILLLASLLVIVLPVVILDQMNQAGAKVVAGIGFLLLLPLAFAFSVFASAGLSRVTLAIVRNEAEPMTRFIASPNLFLRAIGVALLISLVGGVVLVVMFSFVAIIDAAGADALAKLLMVVAMLAALGFVFGLTWQLWACMFVCADDKGTAIGSIRAAQAITSQNKLTSFFIALSALVLFLVGTLMCVVGHVVTAPLTMLMFAVAYLMMTGQAVCDPRDVSHVS